MIDWLLLAVALAAVVVAAVPLHIAVRLFGGRTTILKSIGVNLVAGLISAVLALLLDAYAGLVTLLLTIAVYKVFFSIGWLRALFTWLLSFVVAAALIMLGIALLGLTVSLA